MKGLRSNWLTLLIGFSFGTGLIIAGNFYSFATMYGPDVKLCFDCGMTAGFPFIMYNSGYMWGVEGFLPYGVFLNTISGLLVGGVSAGIASGCGSLCETNRRRSIEK